MSEPSAKLPVFVPRLARTSERTATLLARRIVAPTRAVGARAMSFADRVVGGWLGGTRETRALMPQVGGMPSARSARGAGHFVMPTPWYELPDEQVAAVAPVRAAAVVDAEAPIEAAPAPTVAERGASIPRPQIEAAPEVEGARAERPRVEAAREQARTEAAREIARVEAARSETTRTEAARTEAVREVARVEEARSEAVRAESARVETARTEATRADATRVETARAEAQSEAARVETARSEAVRAETTRVESAQAEVRSEVARVETARTEAVREAVRVETARAEAVEAARTESSKIEAARVETARSEIARSETARTETARAEVARGETARTEATRNETVRAEAARSEAVRGEVARVETTRTEAVREAARVETARTEAGRTEAARVVETTRAEESRVETARADRASVVERAIATERAATAARETQADSPTGRELTAAEALGLVRGVAPAALRAEPARARSPFARALQHADWVDGLRGAAAPTAEAARPTTTGYVFVTPWTPEARTATARPASREAAPIADETPRAATTIETAPAAELRAPSTTPFVAPSALPELRLDATLASTVGAESRFTQFIDRLVGVQAARDVEKLPVAFASPAAEPARAVDGPRPFERAPAAELLRLPELDSARAAATVRSTELPAAASVAPVELPAFEARREIAAEVLLPTASPTTMRPGSIAARAEHLATAMDARAATAWGEPLPAPAPAPRASERALPSFAYVEAPVERAAQIEAVRATAERRAAERPMIAPAPRPTTTATVPTTVATPNLEPRLARELQAARASGPTAIAQFLERLVGVEAARGTSALPIEIAAPQNISLRAPARELVRAETARAGEIARPRATEARRAAERPAVAPIAAETRAAERPRTVEARPATDAAPAFRAPAMAMLRPGGIAVRAEQLGGTIGVRAASLSIDFVDPAGLPSLSSGRASPELSYLWPRANGETPALEAPRAQQAAAASGLSFAEWSLVATFPSSATATQLVSARRAAQWSEAAPTARSLPESPRTLVEPARSSPSIGRAALSMPALGAAERPLVSSGAAAARTGGGAAAAGGAATGGARGAGGFSTGAAAGGASAGGQTRRTGAPSELVTPTVAAGDRAMLPGGRMPRGSFTWPRAASFHPQMLTGDFVPTRALANAEGAAEAAPGQPLWGAMRPLVAVPGGRGAGESARRAESAEPSALESALGIARPILELVRGGVSAESSSGSSSMTARYVAEAPSTPLVTAVAPSPSSEAVSKIIEAVQKPSATSISDDRITLADLTLISMASATQQVAASGTGGGPSSSETHSAHDSGGASAHGGDQAAKPATQSDIENLARQVFDELQHQIDLSRERSGDPWES